MYLNLSFCVPGTCAIEALKFLFPKYNRDISRIDPTSSASFSGTTDNLKLFKHFASSQGDDVLRICKHRSGVSVIDRRETGWAIIDKIGLNILGSNTDPGDYHLFININVQMSNGQYLLKVEESNFKIDLTGGQWNVGESCGQVRFRDNDIPIGIVDTGKSLRIPMFFGETTELSRKTQLALAMVINPKYPTEYIEIDVIEMARQYCLINNIITHDDIAFLEDEVNFITTGGFHELSI